MREKQQAPSVDAELQLQVVWFVVLTIGVITCCQVSSSERFINRTGLLLLITAGISARSIQASLIPPWNLHGDEWGYQPPFYLKQKGSSGIFKCF